MTTTRDIIERAYRKLGIVASDEPMTAEQAQNGLMALNMMMHGLALQGVDLEHADLALTDDFSMAAKFEEGATYLLAQRIAPDNSIAFDADGFLRLLQTAYLSIDAVTFDSGLVYPSSRYQGLIR